MSGHAGGGRGMGGGWEGGGAIVESMSSSHIIQGSGKRM